MIDIDKQYTYNGKPVRIYADGSDTVNGYMHGAKLCSDGWSPCHFKYEDLEEVWEPKEGELCYFWDSESTYLIIDKLIGMLNDKYVDRDETEWNNCAPFKSELPEAFKGLVMTKKERT